MTTDTITPFTKKNANRRASRAEAGSRAFLKARQLRRTLANKGAFGQFRAGPFNDLVVGTTGRKRALRDEDLIA